jgi:hypothetical protein
MTKSGLLVLFGLLATPLAAQSLYTLPDGIETRWASPENPAGARGAGAKSNAGRKGAAFFVLKAGESRTLAEARSGSGTVRRIWMTIRNRTPQFLRGMRIDMYWDGAKTPAVSAPLGDFFGVGLGRMAPFQAALFSSPEGRSFHSLVPMPFRHGMKIVLTNETREDQPQVYYDVNYTLGDAHGADALYFHAHFRRENPTKLRRDYEILPRIAGKGRYLGTNISVIANQERYSASWWGEGEVKIFLDGDQEFPTLAGTGTEDYIGSAYSLGAYSNLTQGAPIVDEEKKQYAFYRYHVEDPVYFRQDIRITIQQIGFLWGGDGKPQHPVKAPLFIAGPGEKQVDLEKPPRVTLFEREDDWSSVAYFYLDRAENGLPALASLRLRTEGL